MDLLDEALYVPGQVGDAHGLDPGLEVLGELAAHPPRLRRQGGALPVGGARPH